MRRLLVVVLAGLGFVAFGGISSAAVAQPAYAASVTTTSTACEFSLAATWKGAKVDQVTAIWTLDSIDASTNFLFTTQTPPNGTIKGHTASVIVGPLAAAATSHTIYARVQFYYHNAQQNETITQLSAACDRNV